MTTAVIKLAKSIGNEIENLKETALFKQTREVVEFVALLSLPILLPFGIMYLTTLG
tara:strand:- start:254 stop:421 length:168 start_codon:yes stop_codon:yes gene_type:complete